MTSQPRLTIVPLPIDEANARLMAAAPAMRDAMRAASAALTWRLERGEIDEQLVRTLGLVNEVLAAIDRAEGRS